MRREGKGSEEGRIGRCRREGEIEKKEFLNINTIIFT